MGKGKRLIVLMGALLLMWGCASTQDNLSIRGNFTFPPGMKVQVQDVSNDTRRVLDVDVIGLFWNALQVKLKSKDLLWTGNASSAPVKLEAHVLKYEKGSAVQRWAMPGFGSTILDARVDVKEGDRVVGSIRVRRTVATGDGLTIGAWKNVFNYAAEDVIGILMTRYTM